MGFSAGAQPTSETIASEEREPRAVLAQSKTQKAETLYRDLARVQPSSPEILSNLGYALHLQGKSSEAITWFKRASRIRELPATLDCSRWTTAGSDRTILPHPSCKKPEGIWATRISWSCWARGICRQASLSTRLPYTAR